ncbi:bifunctional 23S rRNA (guanine(2069)-N(7))-methyltransferase RlmK/23S rRNA (guanine(2445)-N(2))-methyltransferase RlmL [Neiella marina]|uniref:Ribosomal RNA large subunit methyltransferase K/L n=1 Tax=Neiella holothuriorum TaxID=2870530 RepID=A0ABS7EDC8_9GAMM|nr:bifunctional 23S rRNA (guanine(2069)-N(7))-methyltransferase RlmK/23S rRNA (guanine(2445)-N(2))-methyltransferase RlmL [Neiella holothuriorum]MBW8190321.1 bifunctional 23S rRNA (guanine(2069)-N(7))-methyltransferase RlmK/23S rRNA (guanine(2445)-N(2))-methyltransferase RlmL [Neiella holothuriorum]
MHQLFATCSLGLEHPLELELAGFGAQNIVPRQGGVSFSGDLECIYRTLMGTRTASRLFKTLAEGVIKTGEDISMLAYQQDWSMLLPTNKPFTIEFVGSNREIRSSSYGAQCVKDGIFKQLSDEGFARPIIDNKNPYAVVRARLGGNKVNLLLDLTGDSLHQRGYRTEAGEAPLRETVAAGMVLRSGWLKNTEQTLFDPMCGAGTILIEAACMAAGSAPNADRDEFAIHKLPLHNSALWQEIQTEVAVRGRRGLNKAEFKLVGNDSHPEAIKRAKANAERAGVAHLIEFKQLSLADNPLSQGEAAFLLSNPPYGERLGDEAEIIALYFQLGSRLRSSFSGKALLLTSAEDYIPAFKLRSERAWQVMNGKLECQLLSFSVKAQASSSDAIGITPSANEFSNRLSKNLGRLDKWAARVPTDAYRVYDADLPEYNVAIDRYLDSVVIQEYAPPKDIDPEKARRRLLDVVLLTPNLMNVSPGNVFLKTRRNQSGSEQYQKVSTRKAWQVVHEYDCAFKVNLSDYLDTGLFLDHRITRHEFAKLANAKRFLNLFCYTGSATVHAARAGAASTVSVDMSRTYLDWARENLAINHLIAPQHKFEQSDCFKYLQQTTQRFDVVFCDPPTFSNSKRMKNTLDVQRDHVELLRLIDKVLLPEGVIMFSNNYRRFKLDIEAIESMGYKVVDWNRKTLPEDFKRNPHIHHCWLLEKQA